MMADDQGNKRLKAASGAGGKNATAGDARNDALESEIHALRSENARLREQLLSSDAENGRLRQRLQGFAHDVLPVVVPSLSVDLSRLDTGLVVQIASFIGTSRELLNIALTCKSFGCQQPASCQDWSVAEEVARVAVCSRNIDIEGARITLPQYVRGTTSWLSILRESEQPKLRFDTLLGSGIEHLHVVERTTVTVTIGEGGDDDTRGAAIASNYVMDSGIHYAEFSIIYGQPKIGIVRPMPNLDLTRFVGRRRISFFDHQLHGDFLAARTDEWGVGNVHVCHYVSSSGRMFWTNWEGDEAMEPWVGMQDCKPGDTIGMMLNLDRGTVTVFKNDRRLGVMKSELSGSYCWQVEVEEHDIVGISIESGGARNSLDAIVIDVLRNPNIPLEGMHVNDIVGQASQEGFSEVVIRSAMTNLVNEWRIYSTVDEDHYQYAE
ncbi:hypothetical protein THAOC_05521 [Thalassiosira oceanica]|uniref:Replication protein A C-terminal domain-containing protein n=1 Tax=Thalassiosira oceanica TaxID=159749 RepID=K0TGV6_THAOC|nr:hypothetical protein THAOC_05521 [Thalassiosira oceanica]|eukprot:EJK72901.1 hypothetical protein THAOC_05521 [Thalassiosira oceanica]